MGTRVIRVDDSFAEFLKREAKKIGVSQIRITRELVNPTDFDVDFWKNFQKNLNSLTKMDNGTLHGRKPVSRYRRR